jgi:glycosyltransferase involved in cell wall biosynthesis
MSLKVSLVMPTYNRARYVPIAIRCFLQQTYADKELIIVDDGNESLELPLDDRIRVIRLTTRTPTGTKRNYGAEAARGSIIASLDDDDWSSAHRLEDQVRRLQVTSKAVTGYNATVLWDEATGLFYKNEGGPPYFASGTSQVYLKSWWKQHPFPAVCYGEDSVFSRTARLADQLSIADPGKMMVVRKHAGNTDPVLLNHLRRLRDDEVPTEFLKAITAPDAVHTCSPECQIEAEHQFVKPVVNYRTNSIPEVQTR